MIEVLKGKHLKDGTTTVHFTDDGKPLKLDNDTRTPHPDLINAFHTLDIHSALIPPRLMRTDEHKRKKVKEETEEGKVESWFRPEFESKETADEFHCNGFTLGKKGTVMLHGTVKNESNGSMNYNCPLRSLEQTELFGMYDYTEDLSRCIKKVQRECELYVLGKVHPDSKTEESDDNAIVNENTATSITGVGGKEETIDDINQRIAESKKMERETKKRGKQQTAANPSGKD